jgi:site-specific DNA recombinase
MGHTYTSRGNHCYRYYTCYTAQKRGRGACPSKSLPAEEIEQFVVDRIKAIGRDPALLSTTLVKAQQRDAEQIEALEMEQQVVEREMKRLVGQIRRATSTVTGDLDTAQLADLHERLGVAERRRTALQQDLEAIRGRMVTKADVDTALAAFDPVWESLSIKERVGALNLLIKRVDYDGTKGSVSITFHFTGIKTLGTESVEEAEPAA